MVCPKCNKSGFYLCSDKRNAWCRTCGGYFAVFGDLKFYLGNDPSLQYAVKEDGSIRSTVYKKLENKEITETTHLVELEAQFKKLVDEEKLKRVQNDCATDWWYNLTKEHRIRVYQQHKDD